MASTILCRFALSKLEFEQQTNRYFLLIQWTVERDHDDKSVRGHVNRHRWSITKSTRSLIILAQVNAAFLNGGHSRICVVVRTNSRTRVQTHTPTPEPGTRLTCKQVGKHRTKLDKFMWNEQHKSGASSDWWDARHVAMALMNKDTGCALLPRYDTTDDTHAHGQVSSGANARHYLYISVNINQQRLFKSSRNIHWIGRHVPVHTK